MILNNRFCKYKIFSKERLSLSKYVAPVCMALFLAAAAPAVSITSYAQGIEGMELSLSDAPMTIEKAVQTALDKSRTIQSYDLRVDSAEKKVSETKANFGLNVKVKGNYQRVESTGKLTLPLSYYQVMPVNISGVNTFTIADPYPKVSLIEYNLNPEWQHTGELDITKPLFTFGKKKSAVSATKKAVHIAYLESELARLELAKQVKENFQGAILTGQVIELQKESVERSEAHIKDVRELYESGMGIKLDVIRSESELQSAKEQLTTAEKNHTLSIKALNYLIGYPYENKLKVSDKNTFNEIELSPIEKYIDIAIQNRPEIELLKNGREAVLLQMDLEKNKPMVAFAGIWNFHSRGSIFSGQDDWRALLQFEIPIYDQKLAAAKTAQSRLKAKDLDLKEKDLINGIKIQVEKSYLEILEAEDRLQTSRNILQAAEEGYRIATLSYKEGFATQLDVIDVEHNLTAAGLNHVKAKYDYEIAKAGLSLSCGVYNIE
ncbi:MAG TPA: TolC family protein [bacterium]|nr:TolC family protein [bacterium]